MIRYPDKLVEDGDRKRDPEGGVRLFSIAVTEDAKGCRWAIQEPWSEAVLVVNGGERVEILIDQVSVDVLYSDITTPVPSEKIPGYFRFDGSEAGRRFVAQLRTIDLYALHHGISLKWLDAEGLFLLWRGHGKLLANIFLALSAIRKEALSAGTATVAELSIGCQNGHALLDVWRAAKTAPQKETVKSISVQEEYCVHRYVVANNARPDDPKVGRSRTHARADEFVSDLVSAGQARDFRLKVIAAIKFVICESLEERRSGHIRDLALLCKIPVDEAKLAIEMHLRGIPLKAQHKRHEDYIKLCSLNFEQAVGTVNATLVARKLGRTGQEPERSLHRDLLRHQLPEFNEILDDTHREILRDLLEEDNVTKLRVARAIGRSKRGVAARIKSLGLRLPKAWLRQ